MVRYLPLVFVIRRACMLQTLRGAPFEKQWVVQSLPKKLAGQQYGRE